MSVVVVVHEDKVLSFVSMHPRLLTAIATLCVCLAFVNQQV